jgi:Tetratricopeptide repeat
MLRISIAWLALASVAYAAPAPEVLAQAKAHFEAGRAAYDARDFERAISEFEQAQALAPSPMLDHNIGLAHEQLGHTAEAVDHYRRYLKARPDAPNRAEGEKRIATLAPPEAAPGECPPGQTSNEDTAGHCCWPGQVWSKRRSTCAGIPQCPQGLVARGENCSMPQPMQPMQPMDSPWASYPQMGWGAPMAPPGTVPVTFNPKREGYVYVVGVERQQCTAPCTMFLKPGKHKLRVSGDAAYQTDLAVGNQPMTVKVAHMRMVKLVGGAVVTGVGLVSFLVGVAMLNAAYSDTGLYGVFPILAGLVLVPIGIPTMAVTDGNRINVIGGGVAEAPAPKPEGIRLVSAGVQPLQGGASLGLRFSF